MPGTGSASGEDPDAPELWALVEEFHRECPQFGPMWDRHEVRVRRGERKRLRHPEVGDLALVIEVMRFGDGGQPVTVYEAVPGSADEAALGRLAVR